MTTVERNQAIARAGALVQDIVAADKFVDSSEAKLDELRQVLNGTGLSLDDIAKLFLDPDNNSVCLIKAYKRREEEKCHEAELREAFVKAINGLRHPIDGFDAVLPSIDGSNVRRAVHTILYEGIHEDSDEKEAMEILVKVLEALFSRPDDVP